MPLSPFCLPLHLGAGKSRASVFTCGFFFTYNAKNICLSVARGNTRKSCRWGGGLRLHLPPLHPPEIALPSYDQDCHVELYHRSCLFATCGNGQPHFMAAYLYHAVAEEL